jgi:asparagine synthase (glutamine-hydrolysing)
MCGILALITSENVNKERFLQSLNLQNHRGPDDTGYYKVDNHYFGHKRLSIIDLDHSASQPMHSDDGTIVIIFNGEIYNFLELRKDLEKDGVEFKTNGDTEVLIKLYQKKGLGFLNDLNGMFAFILYDKKKKITYVVRDRLGIKPLYYSTKDNCYIFSSEIKSILSLNPTINDLNPEAISSYFSFRYPILNDTFYKDVHSLEPGHFIEIKNNEINIQKYWDLAENVKEQAIDKGEAYYLSRLTELLASSVKYRQIADVKVGAYLSGGVDSSGITALMAQNSNEPVQTFTIGFEEKGYNEFDYANEVAKQYDTNHHQIVLTGKNYLSTMKKLIQFKDAPLSVPNEVPLYLMSKELKKYITVVLSGEGADEIFGGYGRIFRSASEFEKLQKINSKAVHNREEKIFLEKIKVKYGRSLFKNDLDHFFAIYSYTSEIEKSKILSQNYHNEKITNSLKAKFKSYFDELGPEVSYVNKMMYVFEKIHLVGLLHRVDMTTMASSVEARVPFVDHRLVEFAFTIPIKYKLKWSSDSAIESDLLLSEEVSEKHDIPKYILKKSLENQLSQNILYRKKMGFPVPLNSWFGGDFNKYAKKLILEDKSSNNYIINKDEVKKILDDHNLINDHSMALKIWMLMNLSIFIQQNNIDSNIR